LRTYFFIVLLAGFAAFTSLSFSYSTYAAPATAESSAKAGATAPSEPTIGEMLNRGGPLMPVLYALSFLALCLVFYYSFSIRKDLIAPDSLVGQIEDAIIKKDIRLVEEICSKNDTPVSKVVLTGLEVAKNPKASYEMMKGAMEDEGSRQAGNLWERIQYLQDVGIVSPLVGLLGTVMGMIVSFGALQSEAMTPRPTMVAKGIAMAFTNTAAGLVIAIPAMLIYAFFRGRVKALVTDLESKSSRISRKMIELMINK